MIEPDDLLNECNNLDFEVKDILPKYPLPIYPHGTLRVNVTAIIDPANVYITLRDFHGLDDHELVSMISYVKNQHAEFIKDINVMPTKYRQISNIEIGKFLQMYFIV